MQPRQIPSTVWVRDNLTLVDNLGALNAPAPIKIRLKYFVKYQEGPWLSVQQFTPAGRFISAIAVPVEEAEQLAEALLASARRARDWLAVVKLTKEDAAQ